MPSVLLLALLGCSTPPPAPPAVPDGEPSAGTEAPGTAPSEAAPAPVPAVAARKVVRGRLSIEADPPVFEPCEGSLQPSGSLAAAAAEVAGLLPGVRTAYVELAAHEEGGGVVVDAVEVALLDGLGCAAAQADWSWRAFGNEPFWAVEVGSDAATFRSAEGVHVHVPVTGGEADGGWSWAGREADTALSVRLTAERCRDTMADAVYAWKAAVVVGERAYEGCARRRPE